MDFIMGMLLGLVIGWGFTIGNDSATLEVETAIKECESAIPRNQSCTYRIEAFVKRDSK